MFHRLVYNIDTIDTGRLIGPYIERHSTVSVHSTVSALLSSEHLTSVRQSITKP